MSYAEYAEDDLASEQAREHADVVRKVMKENGTPLPDWKPVKTLYYCFAFKDAGTIHLKEQHEGGDTLCGKPAFKVPLLQPRAVVTCDECRKVKRGRESC